MAHPNWRGITSTQVEPRTRLKWKTHELHGQFKTMITPSMRQPLESWHNIKLKRPTCRLARGQKISNNTSLIQTRDENTCQTNPSRGSFTESHLTQRCLRISVLVDLPSMSLEARIKTGNCTENQPIEVEETQWATSIPFQFVTQKALPWIKTEQTTPWWTYKAHLTTLHLQV